MQRFRYHLGIDLHKRFAYWVLLDDERKTLFRGRVETEMNAVQKAVERLEVPLSETHCAIEPVTEWVTGTPYNKTTFYET